MRFGDRGVGTVLRALSQPRMVRALSRYPQTFTSPVSALRRYIGKGSSYPWTCGIRTPIGTVSPTLFTYHDMRTVNEVFCRYDYGDGKGHRVVVDIGANIGLSTLFFLTRNEKTRVHCFEPDPKNIERLKLNLTGFENRYTLHEVAVTVDGGRVAFRTEETGRYGAVLDDDETRSQGVEVIEVDSVAAVEAVEKIAAAEGAIDLVKIDTEGSEQELTAALRSLIPGLVASIVYEDNRGGVGWVGTP